MAAPQKYAHIDFTPPAGARKQAEQGLKLRREHGRGGTAVGIARARDIANGVKLSPSTVRRMKAFFDRHASDSKAEGFRQGEKGWPSNGVIANKLWGGPAGYAWAKKVVAQMEAADARSTYSLDAETSTIEAGTDRRSSVIPNVERRFLGNFSETEEANPDLLKVEERADPETGKKQTYLVGYAARFGKNSLLLGDFVERIAPSAFDIVEKRKDAEGKPLETRCLFNHSPDNLLGRFPTTMRMWVDDVGLRYECLLPETRKDIAELVARGDLKGSSFSFIVAEGGEKWSTEEGRSLRLVTKIKSLLDCGPVTYPAYDSATVAVAKRSYDQFVASKAPAAVVEKRDSGIAALAAEEARKTQEFLADRRGFCPTGPGGGIDNSCGSKVSAEEKPGDDVGAGIHAGSNPALTGAAAGAVVGSFGGTIGAAIGGFVGLVAGAVSIDRYVAKVEKALSRMKVSEKKIDAFARTIQKSMTISATKTGGVQAEGGGVKLTIEKYASDEVGKSLSGRVAFIENATKAIGGKGTESVGRLAGTLAKAGKALGVDHIMVALDSMDRLSEEHFVNAGFTHSIQSDDATRITMIKSYKSKGSRRYDELHAFLADRRGFCPTGPGGGVDNSCGGGKDKGGGEKSGSGEKYKKPDDGETDWLGRKTDKGPDSLGRDTEKTVGRIKESGGKVDGPITGKASTGKEPLSSKALKALGEMIDKAKGSDGPITGKSGRDPMTFQVMKDLGDLVSKARGDYLEWDKSKDHKDSGKAKKAQDFLDKARTDQLARGGKDGGKSDDGGGVQTWSKGDHFPWTTKQVGTDKGYIQGQHPDGSKTAKYPFEGDPSEAHKKVYEEIKSKKKDKRSVTLAEMTEFLMERASR